MNDHDVLQRLLNIDGEAASLVNDAEKEASRRVSEGEKQHRIRYEELYSREVETLEASYTGSTAAAKENYRKQLDEYRESLKITPVNTEAFSAQAKEFFIDAAPHCEGS